jgi:hypothetical protein
MRRAGVGLVIAIAVSASAASAEDDIPPPASIDDAGVTAWIGKHLKAEGWTIIAADGQAVTLGSPKGVAVRRDGLIEAEMRREYYKAVDMGGMMSRSNLQTWRVDCGKKTIAIAAMSIYARSNMQGEGMSRTFDDATGRPPSAGSQNERALKRICEAPTTGKPIG